jgi:AraC-like DNA-binding protein
MSHTPGQRLAAYVDRFQYIAGCAQYADPRTLLTELRDLLESMPDHMPLLDEFAVRTLFAHALSRVLHTYKAEDDVRVERLLVAFLGCGFGRTDWQHKAAELLTRCERMLEHPRRPRTSKVAHVQVMRALRVLDGRYADPALGLAGVAADIGVSTSHLSRELKQHTHRGFVAHLHERRIAAALHLLTNSPHLAIKEVAAAVGYRNVAQLARYCKRLHGVVPTTIRSRASVDHRAAG